MAGTEDSGSPKGSIKGEDSFLDVDPKYMVSNMWLKVTRSTISWSTRD